MGFKRAFKKFRKALGIPAVTLGNVAKAGAIVSTGGVGGLVGTVAASKLKSAAIGGLKQLAKQKAQKLLVKKAAVLLKPPKPVASTAAPATTMPGGAPLAKLPSAAKPRRTKRAKKAAGGAAKPRSGRKAPKGGKDLKALAAAWREAGKPGRWIDWVKSH